MCVTFIFIRPENDLTSKYKLIILNNRDEVLARKTSTLAWENGILCGRDEQAQDRGTWFGVTKQGKVGVLLSITQPVHEKNHDAPSRGAIVPKYLQSDLCAADFVDNLAEIVEPFNGFQFLAFDRTKNGNFELTTLVHKFVDEVKPRKWPVDGGVFGFGNSPPEKLYKKVVRGTELFKAAMPKITQAPESEVVQELLKIAKDSVLCEPDEQFQLQTGFDREKCQFLTSLFIRQQGPNGFYGTRSHSIFLVDSDDNATFYEFSLQNGPNYDGEWKTTVEKFKL